MEKTLLDLVNNYHTAPLLFSILLIIALAIAATNDEEERWLHIGRIVFLALAAFALIFL